jgi:hypothetical protein
MADLEQRLTELAAALEWPATPSLASRITAQITSPPGGKVARSAGWGRGGGNWYQKPWALAAAAVIVAAAALVAYTPSRDAVASWLNLHVFIQQVYEGPPRPSPLPPGPFGKRLGLGSETTLASAQAHVAWHIVIPASLGNPDEVYLQQPNDGPPQGEVTLVYAARPGISASGQTGVSVLITEARGAVNKDFFGKTIGPGTTLQEVNVAGHQAYWISGQPHAFFFIDAAGTFRNETLRLATNTLILDDGGTIIRIEGDLTEAQAIQIAASLA